ncbi:MULTISPECIES: p-hydroxycinnamoyl CoA hydratase/lyase [Pseudonocardia]|uniref:Hydroxycinnamoyl-CoA hydratase-lyase n=2 Tax=Pseudonocardia TaxID=1847 RepID=A0A1Y2MZT8_PSEAH|nr:MULTISPECIES: p-hydroxycinnamoyl CoA hydratase/lyase [Pseudonocardia]OSY40367.1 Hydroxycinnamoyl-CoA hydratase-lyase [Pseudonocardia autotrophica]TDN72302.1 vanillin synthase /trans-feruloyl-CoA hydratase [Pseudonocardia autotrophica]BBG03014.1 p-hydroxycinnamoyl CoA hydratase/lyase [Pseudonocardia autotrophica]GEC25084.1 p-hydroxycinnamoyl CoA hydratase/lyase [Pseudonocardia saturnea]
MTSYKCIRIDVDDRVATVTLDRPEKRNAMSPRLNQEMVSALDGIRRDPDIDVLVLTGAGEAFTAGMDLKEYFRETQHDPIAFEAARDTAWQWQYKLLRYLPQVTIAAVNGWCFGGGFQPLVSCDLAIAADEARFGLSEVNWGIIPAGLVTKDVALAMGYRHAMHYILTGETFDGRRAAEIGLVTSSVPRAELDAAVAELVGRLRGLNPHVLRSAKEVYRHSLTMDYEQAWDYIGAKAVQLRTRDPENGRSRGMSQFLDEKSFRPGLGAYARPGPASDA